MTTSQKIDAYVDLVNRHADFVESYKGDMIRDAYTIATDNPAKFIILFRQQGTCFCTTAEYLNTCIQCLTNSKGYKLFRLREWMQFQQITLDDAIEYLNTEDSE